MASEERPHSDAFNISQDHCENSEDADGRVKSNERSGRLTAAQEHVREVMRLVLRKQEAPKIDATVVLSAAAVYGVLYFAIGDNFLPGHSAWATLLLWSSAHIGALVAYYLYLPRVLGMLAAGILLRNVPWSAIDAFKASWGVKMRAAALATIFLRCGLELDFNTLKRYKYPAIRLALIPGLAEAFFDGGIASTSGVFGMPILLAFTMGFILKAVGPGLVVPAMFRLQKTGLGRDQGIPATVVISASFDDIVAITGYAIFSHVAITGQGEAGWEIAKGPVQVIFGICGGIIAGFILGCTRFFNTTLRRLLGLYAAGLLIMFFLLYYGMLSGGAIGALIVGLITSNFWEKGFPRALSSGPSLAYSPELERYLCIVWNWVMEPILFVTIGSSINFRTLPSGTVGKAIMVVCVGLCVRVIVTFFCMLGLGYNWKERLFFAVAWSPKATIQASLSAVPLAMIEQYKKGEPDYEDWYRWGNDILTTGFFAIVICATLGVLAIHILAPYLLEPAARDEEEGVESETPRSAAASRDDASPRSSAGPPAPGPEIRKGGPDAAAGEAKGKPLISDATHHLDGGEVDLSGFDGRREFFRSKSMGAHQHPPQTDVATERNRKDYELVALYIDSIRQLTAAATSAHIDRTEVHQLSEAVRDIQRRIETEIGRRDLTVRELFRTAAAMANEEFVVRRSVRSRGRDEHSGGPHTHNLPGTSDKAGSSDTSKPSLHRDD